LVVTVTSPLFKLWSFIFRNERTRILGILIYFDFLLYFVTGFFSKIDKAVSLVTTVTLTGIELVTLCVVYNMLPTVLIVVS